MARIKLSIPNRDSDFSTKIPLTVNFINYGNHMGNDAVATLSQETRIRFLKSRGFSELEFYGRSLIQADAAYVYKGEAFHGDVLDVELYIEDVNDYGFDMICEFKCKDKLIAISKNGLVFFDYEARKISKSPSEFLSEFSS